jgi:hypothetical protein
MLLDTFHAYRDQTNFCSWLSSSAISVQAGGNIILRLQFDVADEAAMVAAVWSRLKSERLTFL